MPETPKNKSPEVTTMTVAFIFVVALSVLFAIGSLYELVVAILSSIFLDIHGEQNHYLASFALALIAWVLIRIARIMSDTVRETDTRS